MTPHCSYREFGSFLTALATKARSTPLNLINGGTFMSYNPYDDWKMGSKKQSCGFNDQYENEKEAFRHLQLQAAKDEIRLGYELELIQLKEDSLIQEINSAGGERPKKVQIANLVRGIVISLIGFGMLGIHIAMGLWALEWLELGWKTYTVAIGLSLAGATGAAFLFIGILKIFNLNQHDAYTICLTFVAAFLLLVSMVISFRLGQFRADLIAADLNKEGPEVIILGEAVDGGDHSDTVSKFYQKTLPLLGLIFPLLSLLFDITAGILLHVGLDKFIQSAVSLGLTRQLDKIHKKKVQIATEKDTIEDRPERQSIEQRNSEKIRRKQEEKQNQRQIYRSSTVYRKKKIAFILVVFILVTLFFLLFAANGRSDTVAEIDLSLSEKKTGVSGLNAFQGNIMAIERIIQLLAPGETFYVIGITSNSLTDPLILLQAKLSEKAGYFSERLKRNRSIILASWRKTARKLKPFARETDILGSLELASELLRSSKDKTLYVLSDGKNCTTTLNLERPPRKVEDFSKKLKRITAFPDLGGIDVYWLGVGGPGTTYLHWKSLEHFWRSFIERSGGKLKQFNSLREVQR
jgi:hypothetical protein